MLEVRGREEGEEETDDPSFFSQFPTPEQVLKGAVYMVAMQLSREPLVRRVLRQKYRNQANISVRPTKKGRKEIDENHPVYVRRYLKNKPAKEFKHDEFLKLLQVRDLVLGSEGGLIGRLVISGRRKWFDQDHHLGRFGRKS